MNTGMTKRAGYDVRCRSAMLSEVACGEIFRCWVLGWLGMSDDRREQTPAFRRDKNPDALVEAEANVQEYGRQRLYGEPLLGRTERVRKVGTRPSWR